MRLAGTDGQIQQVVAGGRRGHQPGGAHRPDPGRRSPTTSRRSPASRRPPSCPPTCRRASRSSRSIILVFGVIALLVGIFVIYNTFSIIVQQRTRELALLRAVGASRRQVLSAVIVEGVVVGLIGAAARASASASCWPRASSPRSATTSRPGSPSPCPPSIRALAHRRRRHPRRRDHPGRARHAGAAARGHARRRHRALGRVEDPHRHRRSCIGAARRVPARAGVDRRRHLSRAAPRVHGCRAARASRPSPSARCSPGRASGSPAAGVSAASGITGKLAVENAARSPKRTSATASALLIGVSLVALLLVFADSAKASIDKEISRGFTGDFVVMSEGGGFGGLQRLLADDRRSGRRGRRAWTRCVAQTLRRGRDHLRRRRDRPAVPHVDRRRAASRASSRSAWSRARSPTSTTTGSSSTSSWPTPTTSRSATPSTCCSIGGEELDLTVQGITDDEQVLGYFTITRDTYMASVPEPARRLRVRHRSTRAPTSTP